MEEKTVIKIENLKKQYRLGTIGGGTLSADLQSWWARLRGKEDPNTKIGSDSTRIGERFWALNGINLEVKKGEVVGIIGTNGAGKSTLLKILSRVTAPTEGNIWINGRISSMLEVGTGFHPELTGRENIYMNGAILGMTKKEVDEKIEEIIEFSECRQFIDTPVKRYSSGMYVKLAFSVAAHLDADIMIMDEVLAVGDMKFQKKCLGKMGDAANNEGKTVLYVSHNMNTIRQLCSRCIVLKKGQIVFDGDVEEAIKVYMDEETQELLNYYNFETTARNSFEFAKKGKLLEFEFLEKKANFNSKEKICFRIKIEVYTVVDGVRIQFPMKYADSTNIGMTKTEVLQAVQQPGIYNLYFEYDASNLVPGNYYFSPVLCVFNEYGTREVLDVPMQKIYYSVYSEKENIQWLRNFWGSIILNDIVLTGEEHEESTVIS